MDVKELNIWTRDTLLIAREYKVKDEVSKKKAEEILHKAEIHSKEKVDPKIGLSLVSIKGFLNSALVRYERHVLEEKVKTDAIAKRKKEIADRHAEIVRKEKGEGKEKN